MGLSPEDQIILTVMANTSITGRIMEDLWQELDQLVVKFQCQFTNLQRYGETDVMHAVVASNETMY